MVTTEQQYQAELEKSGLSVSSLTIDEQNLELNRSVVFSKAYQPSFETRGDNSDSQNFLNLKKSGLAAVRIRWSKFFKYINDETIDESIRNQVCGEVMWLDGGMNVNFLYKKPKFPVLELFGFEHVKDDFVIFPNLNNDKDSKCYFLLDFDINSFNTKPFPEQLQKIPFMHKLCSRLNINKWFSKESQRKNNCSDCSKVIAPRYKVACTK